MQGGEHWIIDAREIVPGRLAGAAGRAALTGLFEALIESLTLHPLGEIRLHTFDGPNGESGLGGTTALVPLTESHLAAHGFPEAGVLSLDLYTCRPRQAPDWEAFLARHMGTCTVHVRRLERGLAFTPDVPSACGGVTR